MVGIFLKELFKDFVEIIIRNYRGDEWNNNKSGYYVRKGKGRIE